MLFLPQTSALPKHEKKGPFIGNNEERRRKTENTKITAVINVKSNYHYQKKIYWHITHIGKEEQGSSNEKS